MNIAIRPLEENDALTSWHWRNDPVVFRNTVRRYSGPVTLDDEMNWIRCVLRRPDERRFAILADGRYIGNTILSHITADSAELGIFIGDKDCWNKNVGAEALRLTVSHAFEKMKIKIILGIVRKENKASKRTAEKVGLKAVSADDEFIYMRMESTQLPVADTGTSTSPS